MPKKGRKTVGAPRRKRTVDKGRIQEETADERQERLTRKRTAYRSQRVSDNEQIDPPSQSDPAHDSPTDPATDSQPDPAFWKPAYWNRTTTMEVDSHYCGALDQQCHHCGAKHFRKERPTDGKFTMCCHKGQFVLPDILEFPERLKELITGSDELSKNFRTHIRNFNSALAMASMGANIEPPNGHGPYCFKVHGQVYHSGCALHPNDENQPKYAQLYILDTEQAAQIRSHENEMCDQNLMRELSTILAAINPYARAFKTMHEIEKEQEISGIPTRKMTMVMRHDKTKDKRRYNAPTANEIAVVFEGQDGEPPSNRDFQVYSRLDNRTQKISILNSNLDPMVYPLVFPNGEEGWTDTLHWNNSKTRISQMQFYAYRIAIRDAFSALHHAGKLFQQYLVDAYCKAEANRLNYIRNNQKELRAEKYSGLMDYINSEAGNRGLKAGKMVILPSSFYGSPRNMRESYMDAMRIVQKYGKPDLFITMTCNPNWPEIQENLLPNQTASDRPDLVSRVFHMKKLSLLEEIEKGGIFGKQKAAAHSIEFQKRGLPHAHILIILHSQDKPRCRLDIDKIVCAEIPDENVDADLKAKVLKHNIHNECREGSQCWLGGTKCSKDFPKEFSDETIENVDGYPLYRRKNNGKVLRTPTTFTDNRWVVPYNAYLTKRYDCHINVEICSSVKSVKYIYKYIYKGHDCAVVTLSNETEEPNELEWDEIKSYLNARYVCAPEAAWRIFGFELQKKSHTIVRLAVHLEDAQYTLFENGKERDAMEKIKNTTLTAWFELNSEDVDARQWLYSEICEHYTFTAQKKWKRRKQTDPKVLSRMYFVSPKEGERHYLRLLLLRRKGATSFEDLRLVDGIQYDTYKEAAQHLGLLQDDSECEEIMTESALFHMPQQLREVFAQVCMNYTPPNSLQLFQKFKTDMCEDYLKNYNEQDAENLLLEDLENMFRNENHELSTYYLPKPTAYVQRTNAEECIPNAEDFNEIAQQMESTLDTAQAKVYNDVIKSVTGKSKQKLFYLDGPGGSGKTYTYNTILNKLKAMGKKSMAVAFTGVAANLLDNGATSHSTFGVPVPTLPDSTSKYTPTSKQAQKIREADLILWDEASMIPTTVLHCIDRFLKDITNSKLPFGGKIVLLGGDFRQCLPVVKRGGRVAQVSSCIKSSKLWRRFKTYKLQTNHRIDGHDTLHADWLIQLGDGSLPQEAEVPQDFIKIPEEMLTDNVVDELFPKEILPEQTQQFSDRAILCPLNEQCDRLNKEIIDRIKSEAHTYLSLDSIENDTEDSENMYPLEFANSLNPSGMPPHALTLKKGCIVILIRNLSLRMGLCNGTRLIVRDLRSHVILAEVLNGSKKGKLVFIPRIDISSNEDGLPFTLKRRQFPIRQAFCMTINKSQGQTFKKIGLYLEDPLYSHGMLYVALSRSISRTTTKIQVLKTDNQGQIKKGSTDVYIYNCVYREVLGAK